MHTSSRKMRRSIFSGRQKVCKRNLLDTSVANVKPKRGTTILFQAFTEMNINKLIDFWKSLKANTPLQASTYTVRNCWLVVESIRNSSSVSAKLRKLQMTTGVLKTPFSGWDRKIDRIVKSFKLRELISKITTRAAPSTHPRLYAAWGGSRGSGDLPLGKKAKKGTSEKGWKMRKGAYQYKNVYFFFFCLLLATGLD